MIVIHVILSIAVIKMVFDVTKCDASKMSEEDETTLEKMAIEDAINNNMENQ